MGTEDPHETSDPAIEQSKLDEQTDVVEQRQTTELQVEKRIVAGQSAVHITQEMIPETGVSTEPEPVHPEEPSFPKVDFQGPSMPLGGGPHETFLNEQQPGDVEMRSTKLEQVSDRPEGAARPASPIRVEPMEVEKND